MRCCYFFKLYTVSGTTLTMTGSIAATDDFYVIFSGLTQGTITPPDASVTTAKIVDGAVTSAKLDTTEANLSKTNAKPKKASGKPQRNLGETDTKLKRNLSKT